MKPPSSISRTNYHFGVAPRVGYGETDITTCFTQDEPRSDLDKPKRSKQRMLEIDVSTGLQSRLMASLHPKYHAHV